MTQHTSFRFPSVNHLKRNLGKIDATVECIELSIREFVKNCLEKEMPHKYIEQLSEFHGIKVNDVDLSFLKVRVSQLHIINVYEQAEGFLETFRDEHPKSKNWKYNENDDLFKRIIKNIGADFNKTKETIGNLEIKLFDYYREVRNRLLHPEIDESKNDSKVSSLRNEVSESIEYKVLDAPNTFDGITFDDFILFTRVLKNISKKLCFCCRPTDQEISEIIVAKIRSGDVSLKLQTLKKLKNNSERATNVLNSFLREYYGLKQLEAKPIAILIIQDLLA